CTANVCTDGTPSNPPLPAGTGCNQSGGKVCDGRGTCVPLKLNASTCSSAWECGSGYCADGVCCDASCDQPCRACTAALKGTGLDGVCAMIQAGRDPDNDCPGAATCDGNGSCTECTRPADCPGPDNECQHPTCVSGTCGTSYTTGGTAVATQTVGD